MTDPLTYPERYTAGSTESVRIMFWFVLTQRSVNKYVSKITPDSITWWVPFLSNILLCMDCICSSVDPKLITNQTVPSQHFRLQKKMWQEGALGLLLATCKKDTMTPYAIHVVMWRYTIMIIFIVILLLLTVARSKRPHVASWLLCRSAEEMCLWSTQVGRCDW